ncbi:MAG: hypothetical protein LM577_08655 [Thermoproteaceae archaeon]|nr:hypothetical protein [Thermoproteaceae archaeon]
MEFGDAMYLVSIIGKYSLRLHVYSAAFIGDIISENLLGGAYDNLDVRRGLL